MSDLNFKPFYQDGTEMMEGDHIFVADHPRRIGKIFPPDHILSVLVGAEHGSVEITPCARGCLPLDEDTEFVGHSSHC